MKHSHLTQSEKLILHAVNDAPDKIIEAQAVRRAVCLTPQGFRRVLTGLVNDRLIGRTHGDCITMTFAGMQAIK